MDNSTNSMKLEKQKAQFFVLLSQHVQNFQRTLIMSRRKRQQLIRNRRAKLRQFVIQNLMELESRVLEMVSIISLNDMWFAEQVKKEKKEKDSADEAENDVKPTFNQNHNPHPQQTQRQKQQNAVATPSKSGKITKVPKHPRDNVRFYEDIVTTYSPEKWLETFRMSKATFELLCNQLRDVMQPNGINAPLKNLISLETRCALALYAFATGADYRVIASLFRISRTSVCKFMKRFAESVVEILGPHLLTMPRNEEEYREIRENFQNISNLPALCVGLLGVCEVHVSPQMTEMENYANSAGVTTLVLQALVDDKMLFRKVALDSKQPSMLIDSSNEISKLGVRVVDDQYLPCFVLAPQDYSAFRPWLMQGYENPKASHEHIFNKAITKLQAIKENAFCRLFARWKILQRKGDLEPRTMMVIAQACCALHNLLEEYDTGYVHNWSVGVDLSRFDSLSQGGESNDTKACPSPLLVAEAVQMRDFLARSLE